MDLPPSCCLLCAPALAESDATKGKTAYVKCCHQVGPNAQNTVGPELNNIVGRKAASVSGFAYSPGMKKLGDEAFVWSEDNIDKLIVNPKAMLPDSPMSQLFTGIPDAQERTDIITYLKTVPAQ
jgi:cytochrome c